MKIYAENISNLQRANTYIRSDTKIIFYTVWVNQDPNRNVNRKYAICVYDFGQAIETDVKRYVIKAFWGRSSAWNNSMIKNSTDSLEEVLSTARRLGVRRVERGYTEVNSSQLPEGIEGNASGLQSNQIDLNASIGNEAPDPNWSDANDIIENHKQNVIAQVSSPDVNSEVLHNILYNTDWMTHDEVTEAIMNNPATPPKYLGEMLMVLRESTGTRNYDPPAVILATDTRVPPEYLYEVLADSIKLGSEVNPDIIFGICANPSLLPEHLLWVWNLVKSSDSDFNSGYVFRDRQLKNSMLQGILQNVNLSTEVLEEIFARAHMGGEDGEIATNARQNPNTTEGMKLLHDAVVSRDLGAVIEKITSRIRIIGGESRESELGLRDALYVIKNSGLSMRSAEPQIMELFGIAFDEGGTLRETLLNAIPEDVFKSIPMSPEDSKIVQDHFHGPQAEDGEDTEDLDELERSLFSRSVSWYKVARYNKDKIRDLAI